MCRFPPGAAPSSDPTARGLRRDRLPGAVVQIHVERIGIRPRGPDGQNIREDRGLWIHRRVGRGCGVPGCWVLISWSSAARAAMVAASRNGLRPFTRPGVRRASTTALAGTRSGSPVGGSAPDDSGQTPAAGTTVSSRASAGTRRRPAPRVPSSLYPLQVPFRLDMAGQLDPAVADRGHRHLPHPGVVVRRAAADRFEEGVAGGCGRPWCRRRLVRGRRRRGGVWSSVVLPSIGSRKASPRWGCSYPWCCR
jgi:hypothetical protein